MHKLKGLKDPKALAMVYCVASLYKLVLGQISHHGGPL